VARGGAVGEGARAVVSARRAGRLTAEAATASASALYDPAHAAWRSGAATRAYLRALGLSEDDIDDGHGYDSSEPAVRRQCAIHDWARWMGYMRWQHVDLAKLNELGLPHGSEWCLKHPKRRLRH
jgi:hypothetical protein